MRTFEAVLILVNLLSLVLSFKKHSKIIWLGIAGINLSVFLIHDIFEGFRWQMVFVYVFVILIGILTLTRTSDKFDKAKTTKALKVATVSLSIVFLGLTSFLAYALPVFTLPKPTGSYAVGIQYFHLIDENRTDPFRNGSMQKRELMVKVYYPAKEDDSKPFSPYFHSPRLVRLFATFHGMPEFTFDQLNLVKTNSKDGLQLSDGQLSYPVILFSHGAGTTMEVHTSQCEDLASHGYIVVAIDHTYVSVATVFPDRIVSAKEATTDFGNDPAVPITQIMADDASFVIDQLSEMNEGKIASIFTGRLNLDQIGIIGHSVGGAVAYNLAINDSRVKAAIDLDGVVYITPKGNPKNVAPFLMLANDKDHIQAIEGRKPVMKKYEDLDDVERKMMSGMYGSQQGYDDAYNKAQQAVIGLTNVLRTSGDLFTIEGSDHMKFTNIGLFFGSQWLRQFLNMGGSTNPARCLEITKAVTLDFFDQYLKGTTNDTLESLVRKYPELKKVDLRIVKR